MNKNKKIPSKGGHLRLHTDYCIVLHGDQDFHFKQSQTPDFKVKTETVICIAMCPTTPTDNVVCSVTISRDTVMCSSSPSSMPASQTTAMNLIMCFKMKIPVNENSEDEILPAGAITCREWPQLRF